MFTSVSASPCSISFNNCVRKYVFSPKLLLGITKWTQTISSYQVVLEINLRNTSIHLHTGYMGRIPMDSTLAPTIPPCIPFLQRMPLRSTRCPSMNIPSLPFPQQENHTKQVKTLNNYYHHHQKIILQPHLYKHVNGFQNIILNTFK